MPNHHKNARARARRARLQSECEASEGLEEDNVYIAPSTIQGAGRGVFANKNFKRGDYLAFYDGTIIDNTHEITEQERIYALPLDDKTHRIIGFKQPTNKDGVAQLINDYVRFVFPDIYELSDFVRKIGHYFMESLNNSNVFTKSRKIGEQINFYASEDLKKGQELFFTYGTRYWLGKEGIQKVPEKDREGILSFIVAYEKKYFMCIYPPTYPPSEEVISEEEMYKTVDSYEIYKMTM